MGSHWREISEDLAHGIALTDARLRLIASNYAVPRPDWVTEEGIDLVEDPVELRAVRGHGLPPNWDQAIPMGGA
jgi:hypothetical protein